MKLAIIMPLGTREKLKEQTLRTLKETLQGVNYQIFSKDGMADGEIKTVNDLVTLAGDYEYLLRSDDDLFYSSGWFQAMIDVLRRNPKVLLVGGCYYLLHKVLQEYSTYNITEIAPGNCWLMKKETWDKFGPIATASDGMQEDADFCRRIQATGSKVAVLKEPLIVHCGITGSNGKGRSKPVEDYMKNLINKVGAYSE